jgi:hypothetical protein
MMVNLSRPVSSSVELGEKTELKRIKVIVLRKAYGT